MRRVPSLFAGIIMLAGLVAAQETRGTIQGTVKDPQGGAVADATVIVTNTDTNTSVHLKSDATGHYAAPLLLPGNYNVTGEAAGFKKSLRTGIVLQVTDVLGIDFTLQIGAATESVTVTTEAPLVDITHTDSGRVLDDRSVRDLPVMANTVFTMIQYSAGVQTGQPPALLGPHSTQGGADYSNGTGVGGNSWTIDGAVNDGNARYTANLPSVESVSETKVLTSTYDGTFGHVTGLGIAVTTKSGTNQF
ncbi:MAG TPA: carboxypeptidase-like regulatory domain-containing protein, partial [Bryobacteraceae bacterium]|nr:carboxypeptidase-like regulatory domain-containing protein [Bryobacteraceae bacterium]